MREALNKIKERHLKLLREELVRIQAELIGLNPEKVILFGSAARDERSLTSDLDFIVVVNNGRFGESFIERSARVHRAVKPRTAVDILVYTIEEFNAIKEKNPLIKIALKEGKVLYEKTG